MNRVLKPIAAIIGAAICVAAAAPFAINNSVRPPEDVARDASRNPSAMVAFAKIKAGQTVVDILPGGGILRVSSLKWSDRTAK
jgi:predicted methyltransferase